MDVSGKLLSFSVNGTKIRCQTDGNINIAKDLSEDEPCKDTGLWKTYTVAAKSWGGSVSAKAFLDSIANSQLDIIDLMLGDDELIELEFLTTPGDHTFPIDVVLSGSAHINNFDWANPANAASNYTVDFTGDGELTKLEIPVTT